MTRRELGGLALIMLLAGALRLGWPGLTEFKKDEAHIYQLALALAELRQFPWRGITYSVGLPESAMSVYLFALPLVVWKSPVAATLFMGLLNTLSVGVTYWMVRRYWGVRAALCAALLYAAAPWAVVFSRKIWNNNLLPLFVAVYVLSGLLAFVEGRQRWLIVHGVTWSIAFQLHISAVFFLPVTMVALWVCRRRFRWRPILWTAAAAGLAALPYAIYLLSRLGDWPLALTASSGRTLQVSLDALSMAALLIQGTHLEGLGGPAALAAYRAAVPNLDPLFWLVGVLVVTGLGVVVGTALRFRRGLTPQQEAGLLVAAWLVTPIVLFIPHATPVYPWYFIILFPLPYVLAGISLEAALCRWPQWRGVGLALPVVLAGGQVLVWAATLHFIGTQNTPEAFGTPLGRLLPVAAAARAGAPAEVVVLSAGQDPEVDAVPAVFDALLAGVPHRFVDGRSTALFPADDARVILWPDVRANQETLYQQWSGGKPLADLPLRAGEGQVWVGRGEQVRLQIPRPLAASALLSNGAELLGSGGSAADWELWWRTNGPVTESYQVFAHLLTTAGQKVAQVDQATYANWQADDWVVSRFRLAGGADGTTVWAGMYAYPSLDAVSVLDGLGNPAGTGLEFSISDPP